MKHPLALLALILCLSSGGAALAEQQSPYGSLWIGPKAGAGVAFLSGPRGGYTFGLELGYHTPHYFYYELDLSFVHLLPRTMDVSATEATPSHEMKVTGLFGVPMTGTVGLRLDFGRSAFRMGVAIGAMVTVQAAEALGQNEREVLVSFCFRPELGLDVEMSRGMLRLELAYLWQDGTFEMTGNDHDVDSFFVTLGYTWSLRNN